MSVASCSARPYQLHAYCPACRRHAVLNPMKAAQVAGWDVTLPEIRASLRCAACGHRGADLSVVHPGPGPAGSEELPGAF